MTATDYFHAPSGEDKSAQVTLPAWPVLALLWGFPLWWATGLTVIAGALLSIVMVSYMVVYRSAPVVPGVLAFIGFVVWVLPCALMIDSGDRLAGYFYRTSILVVVAVTFVYALAAAGALTRRRVVNALTFVWFFTIVCGLVALAIPEVRLTTPVGTVLPAGIRSNEYVQDLFFPPMAEIQRPWGSPTTFIRPAAPFPYANSWGVAVLLLSPVAAACFMLTRRLLVRGLILVGFVTMLPSAIATGNRGMFGALALAMAYVLLRLTLRNRAAPVLAVSVLAIVGVAVAIAGGLIERVSTRQEYGDSTGTRLDIYRETFSRTLESPLMGYGAPRPSAYEGISLGTQGYLWMLMFSYGFVGLILFLTFLWGTTLRTLPAGDDVNVVLHSVLISASLVIVVYGLDLMQLLTIVLVAAILLRDRYGPTVEDRVASG